MKILKNFLIFLSFILNFVKCQYNWSNEIENNLKIEDVFDDFEFPLESYKVPENPAESEFCIATPLGPRCQFTHLNKTIIVDENYGLNKNHYHLLGLEDMSAVIIYPSCVSWIEIYNASYVKTATNNSTDPDSCKTWLRIYGANVTRIEHGVKDLSLFNSYAEFISLENQRDITIQNSTVLEIEKLDYIGYDGTISNSYIKKMKFVNAFNNMHITNSHIHIMGVKPYGPRDTNSGIRLYGDELQITNTTIDYLYSFGIETNEKNIILRNVYIKHCSWHGIHVEQGKIEMINVTVEKVPYEFLYVGTFAEIFVENVTVEGIPVNNEEIKKWPKRLPIPGKTQVSLNDSYHCNSIEDEVICNYIDAKNQNIELDVVALYGENPSIKNITIKEIRKSTTMLYMDDNLCGVHLTLDNVKAMYQDLSSNTSELCLDRPSIVKIYNSIVYTSYNTEICNFKILEIINSHIGHSLFCRNNPVDSVTAINSSLIDTFSRLNLKKWSTITMKDTFGDFTDTYTEGVIDFENSALRLHHFTIHNEDGRMSSVKNVSFSDTRTKIILEKGNLTIDFLTIHGIKPRNDATNYPEIYIGKEGKLYIVGDIPSGLKDHKAIYAYDLNQIVLEKGVNRSILNHIVKLTEETKPKENKIVTVIGTRHCISSPLNHHFPNSTQFPLWICDYTDQNVHIDLKIQPSEAEFYQISGANSITIYQCCVFKIFIVDSKNISSAVSPYYTPCTFSLEITNSEIYKLTENIVDLHLYNSTAKFISFENELNNVVLIDSHVDVIQGLTWTGTRASFMGSTFRNVSQLNAKIRSEFFRGKIEIIENNGIYIDGLVTFAEMNITKIKSNGLNVNNYLIMENVIIDNVEDSAFKLTEKADVVMTNVTIKQGTLAFMELHDSSRVTFHNVTLMGQLLYRKVTYGFIENTTASSMTPTKTTLTTKPPTTNELIENTTTVGQQEYQPNERKLPKIWIGTVLGFIFGVIVAVIIVSVITMKRSRRLLPSSRMRWQIRESQNELIDAEELQSSESYVQDQYARIPDNMEL